MLRFNDIQEGDTLRFTKSSDTSPGFHGVVFTILKKYMRNGIYPSLDIELVTPSKYNTNEAGSQLTGVGFSENRFERTTVNPAYLLFS